jgi:hypothetical protein
VIPVARTVLVLVFFALLAFDGLVIVESGYLSIFIDPLKKLSTSQVLADLLVSLGLISTWVYQDLRRRGKPAHHFWIFLLAALALGALAPLLYLIIRSYDEPATP